MIQCVGARNKEHPECSRICCTVAVKNALKIKSIDPRTEVYVLYKDVRTYGFTEDRYREARGKGVHFVRYSDEEPPMVKDEGGRLSVDLKDPVIGKRLSIRTDLLVLSVAVHPNLDNEQLAKALKVAIGNDGFLLETHMKMRPVDFSTEGVFLCGLAHGPKCLGEATVQALAAASHAYNLIAKGHLTGEVIIAQVNPDKCRGCGRCEEACEFAAIHVVTEAIGNIERMVSKVDPARCKGCGRCSVVCCNKSIAMSHFTTAQVNGIVDASLGRWP
jgi:heterodisulfide reductase subunit A